MKRNNQRMTKREEKDSSVGSRPTKVSCLGWKCFVSTMTLLRVFSDACQILECLHLRYSQAESWIHLSPSLLIDYSIAALSLV